MDSSRVLTIMLLIFVLLRLSDASTRSLVEKVSQSPAPNYSPSNKEVNKNSHAKAGLPPDSYNKGASKSEERKKKDDGKLVNEGPNGDKYQSEKCDGSLPKCHVKDLVACLRHSETANPKEWVVVVQNVGDDTLSINVSVPASVTIDAEMLNVGKHGTQKVNISTGDTNALKIVLNAGNGVCILQFGIGPSISNWMQHFPVYAKQFTPMYGASFLLFTLIMVGAIWGYCKFRKVGRRDGDGARYQQLEMGSQMQSNTEIVEAGTSNGWEEGWDDEWDEEEARARPSTTTNPNRNASSSNDNDKKNGWDIDWDD